MSNKRNRNISKAVANLLERIDFFIDGGELELPPPEIRHACDIVLKKSASISTACLFLLFYKLCKPTYQFSRIPTGARGKHGDKLLCEELTKRSLTLHNNIVAYFENIGSKGGVKNFNPLNDDRMKEFLSVLTSASNEDLAKAADYLAEKYASSQRLIQPLPPVGAEVLTFVRAKALFFRILDTSSEGFFQQFLITALLREFRRKQDIVVRTHHPHASDTFDKSAGDIEEYLDDKLYRAYEITVRDDWKNRVSNFKSKMDKFGLKKYVIVASMVNEDVEWAEPAQLALSLEKYERDIAVIDIKDVVNFFAAELDPGELRGAVNQLHVYLANPTLCGRHDLIDRYTELVSKWLDD